jgi:hypothetical protein
MTVAVVAWPARVCYHGERGYFVQIGPGDYAEYFDHGGNQIDRNELFIGDMPVFREGSSLGLVTTVSEAVELLNSRYSPKGYAVIHLADDEWGNEMMFAVAQEYFTRNPDEDFVEVYEHGGWFLGFRRDGSCWTTANDLAILNVPFPQPTGPSGKTIRRQEGRHA